MKLGKLPPKFDGRTFKFGSYITSQLPPPPASVNYYQAVSDWGLMGNGATADCACAAAGHMVQAWTANNQQEIVIPDQQILDAYAYFVGDKTEEFVHMLDVLNYWRTTGIGNHKIIGYAILEPKNQIQTQDAVNLFGSCYIGLALPNFTAPKNSSLADKLKIPWEVPSQGVVGDQNVPNTANGHCVPALGYDQRYLYVVTWGQLKPMSWAFYQAYMDEAYAVFSQDWINSKAGTAPSGFDFAALQNDLGEINGPSRDDIKPQVIKVLNSALPPRTPVIPDTLTAEQLDLEDDCNMLAPVRRALAGPLTQVATSYPNGMAISPSESVNLQTVGDAIDLTWKKAQGPTPILPPVGRRPGNRQQKKKKKRSR